MSSETLRYDIAVIGAGLAGTSAASACARAGYATVLIDSRAEAPPEFRAEKLGDEQMRQFDRLGLGASVRAVTTPIDEVCVVRFGRLVHRERKREYGMTYAELVNRMRADLPPAVTFAVARVEDVATDRDGARLTLSDGRRLSARLLVVSTGLGDAIRRKAGISRRVVSKRHSLSIGFDMAAPREAFPFESLTYYAESFGTNCAYFTAFPIRDQMRGNLFVYREPAESWTKAFAAAPEDGLRTLLPRLPRICPDLRVSGPVEVRPIDLFEADDPARDAMVLIGDAYFNPCPIPGTGIGKVLVDVERLCTVHVPHWLSQPAIDRAMVQSFYDDPVKRASDGACRRANAYARDIGTRTELPWVARRGRNYIGRHIFHAIGRTG
jgi:2-polyprenyl-6-methoxyphenol hydroxylase-like FAD-dependent oxidoreductase